MIDYGKDTFEKTLNLLRECAAELDSFSIERLSQSELKSAAQIFDLIDEMKVNHRTAVRNAYEESRYGQ